MTDPILKHRRTISDARLIIFTKYPVPGKTKTRLIPLLGPARAADLQKRLAEKTFQTGRYFTQSHDIDIEICFDNSSEKKMKAWLGTSPVYSRQVSGDIGNRMHNALLNAFSYGFRRVVLIGTDIPDITEAILDEAFSSLSEHDLVLGPSTDGGYWLIGLNKPEDLFHGIKWSTRSVLEQTLRIAGKKQLTCHLLHTLTDIDTENNLKKILPDEANHTPYISVIIPTLNESKNIEPVIRHAKHMDSEILVVDGGSKDDTATKAEETGAHVISGPRSRARQQNIGAERASGNVLLFLHADTTLPENYTSYVFDALMDRRVVAGAFKFKTDFSHPFMTLVEIGANIRSRYFRLPYGDQALFLRKTVFDSTGGFPEVAIAEDLFFVRSLLAYGKIQIVPAHIITSGRRWRLRGPIRTWLINTLILAGCKMGVSPEKLKPFYGIPDKNHSNERTNF